MYLVLLVFGVVLAVAGIALGASGVSLNDRVFDASIVAPGILAVTGGLILVGLGLALRVLQRIEGALAARPMPRAIRPGEPAAAETSSELVRALVSPKPESRPQALHAGPAATDDLAEAKGPQLSRLQFPTLARIEDVTVAQENEVSLLPTALLRVNQVVGEFNGGRAPKQSIEDVSARIAPRLDVSNRSSRLSDRPKGQTFDALWPKGSRPTRPEQTAPAPDIVPPTIVKPNQPSEPAFDASAAPAPDEEPEVSILKSGVVDGMAYTLYSDGSIEAQLPQGALRFGSINELRNHIEQSPDAASS